MMSHSKVNNSEEKSHLNENQHELQDISSAFNLIIGHIEDLLVCDDFHIIQNSFLEKYYHLFDNDEENKLEYMDIFFEYQSTIEVYIEEFLKRNIKGFCMKSFINELLIRRNDLEGEIFEMLFTLSDFVSFKEMFLDYKAMKDGKTVDLSNNILVTKLTINYM